MAEPEHIRTGKHFMFALHTHLVFVTKFRHKMFDDRHLTRTEEIMQAVCGPLPGRIGRVQRRNNHIHPLVNFPPKVAVTRLVNSLKGVSSRRLRQEFPDLRWHYYQANNLWSGSYFAGSLNGAPLSVARHYIQQQNPPA